MFSNEQVLGIFQSFSSQHRLIRKKNAQPQNLYAESFRTLATSFLLIVKVGWDGRWLFYVILCRIHATTSIGEDLKTSFDGRDSDISECIDQFSLQFDNIEEARWLERMASASASYGTTLYSKLVFFLILYFFDTFSIEFLAKLQIDYIRTV